MPRLSFIHEQAATLPPFPSHAQLVRTLASALGMSYAVRRYKDDKTDDYHLLDQMVDALGAEAGKRVSVEAGKWLVACGKELGASYSHLVAHVYLDGMPRQVSLPLLAEHYFGWMLAGMLQHAYANFDGPLPHLLLNKNHGAVAAVFQWLVQESPQWRHYHERLSKVDKDTITDWQQARKLPEPARFSAGPLRDFSLDNPSMRQTLLLWLLLARALDTARTTELGRQLLSSARHFLWSGIEHYDTGRALSLALRRHNRCYDELSRLGLRVYQLLGRNTPKRPGQHALVQVYLNTWRELLQQRDPQRETDYFLHWMQARFALFSGDLPNALGYYRRAFAMACYRAGPNQKDIINEAMVTAAMQPRADKTLLKQLRNMWVLLGNPPLPFDEQPGISSRYQAGALFEEWELTGWQNGFNQVFPAEAFFPEAELVRCTDAAPFWAISEPDAIRPDFRHPDRKMNIGDKGASKRMPQLVWFAHQNDLHAVNRLLEAGACVDLCSESGDSALLMAVRELDVALLPNTGLDDRLFWRLAELPHAKETVNRRTAKKRLLPLLSAVGSGRPEVVRQLLNMQAEPDLRGGMDSHTALYYCLQLIGWLKFPERSLQAQNAMGVTPAVAEAVRRRAGGMFGVETEDVTRNLHRLLSLPHTDGLRKAALQLGMQHISEHLSLDGLRQIAHLLLQAGAEPNAVHQRPVKGYTPLMLAAESDEAELFSAMLEQKGDPDLSYLEPQKQEPVNCWQIALYFGADTVLKLLQQRYPDRVVI